MKSSKYEYRLKPEGGRTQIEFRHPGRNWMELSSYPDREMALDRVERMIEDDNWKPEIVRV